LRRFSSAAGWGNAASIVLATALAFVFGYSLTLRPLVPQLGLRGGWSLAVSLALAFAAAFPVNRALIGRGRRHAAAHAHHH
jgi:hypothetical protein